MFYEIMNDESLASLSKSSTKVFENSTSGVTNCFFNAKVYQITTKYLVFLFN